MTNEEAIVQLEIDATNLVGRLASEPVHDTSFSELWERKLEAIDIAIYAIKMFDKHEAECERCACNLLAERDALKEEKLISNADVADVVHCGDCLYWQDRQVMLSDGSCRNYLPDEPDYVTASVGINMGAHCTKHGFEDESGSWFWANACDFCSRGERRPHNENTP